MYLNLFPNLNHRKQLVLYWESTSEDYFSHNFYDCTTTLKVRKYLIYGFIHYILQFVL